MRRRTVVLGPALTPNPQPPAAPPPAIRSQTRSKGVLNVRIASRMIATHLLKESLTTLTPNPSSCIPQGGTLWRGGGAHERYPWRSTRGAAAV